MVIWKVKEKDEEQERKREIENEIRRRGMKEIKNETDCLKWHKREVERERLRETERARERNFAPMPFLALKD